MFNLIKKLLGAKPGVPDVADRPSLRDMDIFIFAALGEGDGIPSNELTQEKLLEQIRRSAEEINKRQSFEPFIYEANGQRRLPFFTSHDHAKVFVGEFAKQRDRVYPFQCLEIKRSVLIDLSPACDVLVMNDGSPDVFEIPARPKI